MRNRNIICSLSIIILSLISCNNENESKDDYIYPLSIGNNWEYVREMNMYFYSDSNSVIPEYEDTLNLTFDLSATITDEVTLNDTLETIEMSVFESDSENTYMGKYYYKNNNDGLFMCAYKSPGSIIYPKKTAGNTVLFKGMEFDNYYQLSDFIQHLTPNHKILSDSLHFEEPPVKTLQYPLKVGDQWTYRQDDNPWRMDRKVINRKDVELSIGTFDCYEVKFLFDLDHNGEWDEDIWIIDYISNEGLIQRTVTILGIEEGGPEGPTGRLIDSFDRYILTDFDVK